MGLIYLPRGKKLMVDCEQRSFADHSSCVRIACRRDPALHRKSQAWWERENERDEPDAVHDEATPSSAQSHREKESVSEKEKQKKKGRGRGDRQRNSIKSAALFCHTFLPLSAFPMITFPSFQFFVFRFYSFVLHPPALCPFVSFPFFPSSLCTFVPSSLHLSYPSSPLPLTFSPSSLHSTVCVR